MPRKKKPEFVEGDYVDAIVIDQDAQSELHSALIGAGRSAAVVGITRRALTMRANGATNEEIARAEHVEESTLSAWLASPRRVPTPEEAQRMINEEIKPLAIENHLHQLLAGDKRATSQTMKDSGLMRPPKLSGATRVSILVGIGTNPIGSDPIQIAVAVKTR